MNQASAPPDTRPEPDAVKRALDVLGDRWTFLVLREAFFGVRRFGYFQRNLGIGRNVLSNRAPPRTTQNDSKLPPGATTKGCPTLPDTSGSAPYAGGPSPIAIWTHADVASEQVAP